MQTVKDIRFLCGVFVICLLAYLPTPLIAQSSPCSGCGTGTNLVTNGDFSANSTTLPTFTSTSLNPICDCNDSNGNPAYGSYCIDTEAQDKCFLFSSAIYDHTFGNTSGRYMIVDGFPNSDPPTPTDPNIVWKEAITVPAAGSYEFSFWWHPNVSGYTNASPIFDFRVDYTAVINNIGSTATLNAWNEFCTTYNFPAAGTYVIEIAQTNTGNGGYDYGIDDIYLGECCSCDIAASITAVSNGPLTFDFTANVTTNACTNLTSVSWNFGDGSTGTGVNVSHTYASSGWYTVQVFVNGVDNNGHRCKSKAVIEVFVERPVECQITADFTYTSNASNITANNFSNPLLAIDRWDWELTDPNSVSTWLGSSVASNTNPANHPVWDFSQAVTDPGTYTLCLFVYDDDVIDDCMDFICYDIIVKPEDDAPCDVNALFDPILTGPPNTYHFDNLSTASSSMTFFWTVRDLNSINMPIIHTQSSPPNTPDLNYSLPGQGSFEICLQAYQPAGISPGEECFDVYCRTVYVDSSSDYLNFGMYYICNEDIAELYINPLNTNAGSATISVNCSAPATGIPNTTLNAPYASQMPYLIATEPALTYSTCTVTITTSNSLTVTQTIYFNCQACPDGGNNKSKKADAGPSVSSLEVYPNPSKAGEVMVRIKEMSGPLLLEVLDQQGRSVRTMHIDLPSNSIRLPLQTQSLAAGLYLVRVSNDQEQQIQKVIIQK